MLGGLAAFAVGWRAIPAVFDRLSSGFDFEELKSPKGFRTFAGGEVSAPINVFAGLEAGPTPDLTAARAAVDADITSQLFYAKMDEDAVQVAYFSDFYCPICRVISSDLIEVMGEERIEVSWHETPLFGEASELAARAAIAAGAQGAYVAFHDLLVSRPVVVSVPYLQGLVDELGLDVVQFTADLSSDDTQAVLNRAAALAEVFRFIGTPAMVVGRTVFQGRISKTNLRQLIAIERG